MTDRKKELWSILGLIMITVWASLQYVMLRNVPSDMPQFTFLCITSLLGFIVLAVFRFRKFRLIGEKTVLKGLLFSAELCSFNYFLLIGTRNTPPVISSSVVSMYFVFITPLLLLCRRKVSFRSVVAGLVAIIALLLLFGADADALIASPGIVYLIISAFFFATYVVSISILGETEDATALTLSQLFFAVLLNGIGWLVEARITGKPIVIPSDTRFWLSALFIGLLIRAIYSIIQISAQKHVQPIKASLILSGEIIFTLIFNPFISRLMHIEYTPVTTFQVIGCILFVIAMMLTDDLFMSRFGYMDMQDVIYTNSKGEIVKGRSISRKTVNLTLIISLVALTLSSVICLAAIAQIKTTTLKSSTVLGQEAASESESALTNELEFTMTRTVGSKAEYADVVLSGYSGSVSGLSSYASSLYSHPERYASREALYPLKDNGGVWTMQRTLADGLDYEAVRAENGLLGNLEDVFRPAVSSLDNIATVYIGTENGLLIAYDPNSDLAYTGGESYFEYRDSDWYTSAKTADGPLFTSAYQDSYGRGLTVTCYCPVRDENNVFRGVVGMDILVDSLNTSLVSAGIEEPSQAWLLNSSGEVIACGDPDLSLDSGHPVRLAMEQILSREAGLVPTGEGESAEYVAFSSVALTGWRLCLVSPVSEIIAPAVRIRDNIDNHTTQVVNVVNNGIHSIVESCLILFAIIVLTITFIVGKFSLRISSPLQQLEKDVRDMGGGNLAFRTVVETDDEIGSLATTFNSMADSLQNYIVELKDATAKEERIASELSLAQHIQASMLPSSFPAFPDRTEFDLYASMDPAKEVGGDFYDFFLIDESHLGLVIADVSGKGVPAALFMVIAKTLIKMRALQGGSPAQVLAHVNNQLMENNEAEMFVTAWFGVLDLKTGILTAANAGHEFPVIGRAGKDFELFRDRHGLVLAAMQGSRYTDYELRLEPGDTLLVYTDGVPEATAASMDLFGTERLTGTVNASPFTSCRDLVDRVSASIGRFVLDAPQFDDITMLCVHLFRLME